MIEQPLVQLLLLLGAFPEHVDRLVQSVRDVDYEPVREGSPVE